MLASQTLPYKPPKKGKHSRCELAVALETAAGTQFRAFWPEHSGPSIRACSLPAMPRPMLSHLRARYRANMSMVNCKSAGIGAAMITVSPV